MSNTEFQVNTYTQSSQNDPSITGLSDGGFVVTWGSDGQDGSGYGVFGQRFDANGDMVERISSTDNQPPSLPTDPMLATNEDTASSAIEFSATDVDGDNRTYSFSNPSTGLVTDNNNGTYTYTPAANENGSDSFTLTVSDGAVNVSQTVDVTINAVNDLPTVYLATRRNGMADIVGTENDDVINGTDQQDWIQALGGNDTVYAVAGAVGSREGICDGIVLGNDRGDDCNRVSG